MPKKRKDSMKPIVRITLTLFLFIAAMCATAAAQATQADAPRLPNPMIIFTGAEYLQEKGMPPTTRYNYAVFNFDSFPNTMFAAAPALPPCGANNRAARTWVDIFDQRGKRLSGFCALGSNRDLNRLWFALPSEEVPP